MSAAKPQRLGVESLLAVALGLALAAASGLRVFIPLLALSVASATGHVALAPGYDWIASTPAIIALAAATLIEVAAYAIPWLDHALDVIATPLAVLAGILASASVLFDLPPVLKWSIVIIGGGGIAGLTQGATVLARLKSGLFTGGLANPVISVSELAGAVVVSLLALFVPVAALVGVLLLLLVVFRRAGRLLFGRRELPSAPGGRATQL